MTNLRTQVTTLCLIFLVCFNTNIAFAQDDENPQEGVTGAEPAQPDFDNHGIGFGLGTSGVLGLTLFYDYNLNQTSDHFQQVHVQIFGGDASSSSLFGNSEISLSKSHLTGTYRHVWRNGWYVGAGVGSFSAIIKYKYDPLTATDPVINKEFALTGLTGVFECGWQGNEFYYFHVGIQPSFFVSSEDNYDINKIPDVSNHRSRVEEFRDLQESTGLVGIGFGWYLQP